MGEDLVLSKIEKVSCGPRASLFILIILITHAIPASSEPLVCNWQNSHIGAGIIPFHINADSEVKILLGFEHGRGWSALGGGPKAVESENKPDRCETTMETAAREAEEESRSLLTRSKILSNLTEDLLFKSVNGFTTYFLRIEPEHINSILFKKATVVDLPSFKEVTDIAWFKFSSLEEEATQESDEPVIIDGNIMWKYFWPGFKAFIESGGKSKLISEEKWELFTQTRMKFYN